jgi:alcohol dehydrogenase
VTANMQALTYQGPHTVVVSDVPIPTLPDQDSVLVQISSSGICGSDLHTYAGHGFVPNVGFSLGHEAVGRIVEAGSNVRNVRTGNRVLIAASAGCLDCPQCSVGWVMGCTAGGAEVYGVGVGPEGLQAQFAAVRNADRNVFAISDSVNDDAAILLTDNLPTGWCAARQAGVSPGATVAVIGLGPVGLCAVMSAITLGAARVLAIDPLPHRRALAERLGAEGVFDDDLVGVIRETTGGRNAESVIEAVGSDTTIQNAIQIASVGGSVSIAGVPASMTLDLPVMHMFIAQVAVRSALCSVQRELRTLMPLVEQERMQPDRLVSHHFSLSDGAAAYKTFADRMPGTAKVIITIAA